MSWHRPSGQSGSGTADLEVTPEDAGWAYSGLRVVTLGTGDTLHVDLTADEAVVVPLSTLLRRLPVAS